MRSLSAFVLVAATVIVTSGCGGGPSQAEMMRNAIRRPSDDDDEVEPAQSTPVADVTAENAAEEASPQPPTQDSPQTGEVASNPPPQPPPAAADDRNDSPGEADAAAAPAANAASQPQSVQERRAWTIANLDRIAKALSAYVKENGAFPQPAIKDPRGKAALSWRVELLPYLGLQELHARFHLDESWDSPHNKTLLAAIPDVYRSPERFDEKTNYLLPTGAGTLFPPGRSIAPRRIEDGLANTLLLLEVDDGASVPWTQPADYVVNFGQPARSLGNLRSDGFFLAWADGSSGRAESGIDAATWKAMMTPDSGEAFSASAITFSATEEPVAAAPVAAATETMSSDTTSVGVATPTQTTPQVRSPSADKPSYTPPPSSQAERLPVPTGATYEIALQNVRDIFHADYASAINGDKKRELAGKLLSESARCKDDAAQYYATLDVCRRIAAEAGDVSLAQQAVAKMEQRFLLDSVRIRTEVVAATAELRLEDSDNDAILHEAMDLIDAAQADDRFDLALQAHQAALAAARRSRNGRLVTMLESRRRELRSAEDAFHQIAQAITVLADTPDDPQANLQVGGYYCFVKARWEDGLPMLAAASDSRLAILARTELESPRDPREQVALADRWWLQSERSPEYQTAIRNRAVFWYQQALPNLDAGHEKIRAEMRSQLAGLTVAERR